MKLYTREKWLKSLRPRPCPEGFRYWKTVNKPYLPDFARQCLQDDYFHWASWLMIRSMDKKQYQKYAIFGAEQVIDFYEAEYPQDNRPRRAIEAAKRVVKYDSQTNRQAAASANDAANDAAYTADAIGYTTYAAYAAYAAARAADTHTMYAITSATCAILFAAFGGETKQQRIIEFGIELMEGSRQPRRRSSS